MAWQAGYGCIRWMAESGNKPSFPAREAIISIHLEGGSGMIGAIMHGKPA
ncbi:MAG: hypothetical protein AB1461_06255 [Thermodesulfobacteriota bacterium]